jgi:hypothetical protein
LTYQKQKKKEKKKKSELRYKSDSDKGGVAATLRRQNDDSEGAEVAFLGG